MTSSSLFRLHTPAGLPPARGFAQVAEVLPATGLVITSSQLPLDAEGKLVGKGDFAAQVEQVFQNLSRALQAAGTDLHHVVRITYYGVATLELPQLGRLGEARIRHLNMQDPPASAFIYVPRFIDPEILFEAEAIAVRP
jgi:enamine deaminase RidA (YjgF/YER057c/UK114 family)